jgi:hypothetical protein
MRIIFFALAFFIASLLGAGLTFGDRHSFGEIFSFFTKELPQQNSQPTKPASTNFEEKQPKPIESEEKKLPTNDLTTFYVPTATDAEAFYINKYHKEAIAEISKALDAVEKNAE